MLWINNSEPQTFGWEQRSIFYEVRYKASAGKHRQHIDNRYIGHATDKSHLPPP